MSRKRRPGRIERARPTSRRPEPVGRTQAPPSPQSATGRWLVAAAVVSGLVALLAYLFTAQQSLAAGDSGDLVAAAYVLGIPHPPGYPLFAMLAHLAMLAPFGSPATAANLLTAALDAGCVAVVAVLVVRLVAGPGRMSREDLPLVLVASAVGALLLAFSTAFWLYSLGAEVFSLNNLLAALLLLIVVEWARGPRPWHLAVLGLLFGLALANQLTIVLIAPGLAILVLAGIRRSVRDPSLTDRPERRYPVRETASGVGMVAIGLLPYLYLPIAAGMDPPVNWGDPRTLDRFVDVVLRSDYGSLSLSLGVKSGSIVEQWMALGSDLLGGFVVVGVALALVGLHWLWRRDRIVATALSVAFLVSGPLFVAYANPDFSEPVSRGILQRFYILPALPVAVAAGVGAHACLAWVVRRMPGHLAAAGAATVLLLVPTASAVAHAGAVDQSGNRVAQRYAEDLLGTLDPGAILLMRGDENYTSVIYAQFVEHIRGDVAAMDVELLKQPQYVQLMLRLHPEISIPWPSYREGPPASLTQLVDANLGARPVYYVGAMKEATWTAGYDEVHAGLARRLVQKGQGGDGYGLLRQRAGEFAALHYPDRLDPPTTWEAIIEEHYGVAAFDLGYALQSAHPAGDSRVTEAMYRAAIRLAPDTTVPSAYKNLGVLLDGRGGDPKEVIALWQHFLRLSPNDADAPAIRTRIVALGGQAP